MRRVEGNVRSRRVFFFFSFSKIDDERFQARFQARLHDNRISPPFFFLSGNSVREIWNPSFSVEKLFQAIVILIRGGGEGESN